MHPGSRACCEAGSGVVVGSGGRLVRPAPRQGETAGSERVALFGHPLLNLIYGVLDGSVRGVDQVGGPSPVVGSPPGLSVPDHFGPAVADDDVGPVRGSSACLRCQAAQSRKASTAGASHRPASRKASLPPQPLAHGVSERGLARTAGAGQIQQHLTRVAGQWRCPRKVFPGPSVPAQVGRVVRASALCCRLPADWTPALRAGGPDAVEGVQSTWQSGYPCVCSQ